MRVLLDTNVVRDVLLMRAPWVTEAAAVWRAHEEGRIAGYLGATTLANIFYVARRIAGRQIAHQSVELCLSTFQICTVDHSTLQAASSLPGSDFEDNLQMACAIPAGLDATVTRDLNGFRSGPVPALAPAELLTRVAAGSQPQ